MKNILLILTISMVFLGFKSDQKNDKKVIENFISGVINKKPIDNYIIPIENDGDSISIKRRELLNYQISELQKQWKDKDLKKITIVSYKSLPGKIDNILIENDHAENNIYEVRYDNNYFFTVLIDNHLIKSFTLVHKGGDKKFFLTI